MRKISAFFYNNLKFLFFFEFIISFILIIILVLILLKKNFINVYCLTAFNIIFFLLFLTFLFQNFIINKIFYIKNFYVSTGKNSAIYTFDTLLTFIFLQGFHYSIRYKFLYTFNLVFYTKSLNIN